MKKNVRFALDISVLIAGVLLLGGIFLCDRILMQFGPLQISHTDLLWSHYQKLERLQGTLKYFEEYKEKDIQNDYRKQILARKNWLLKGQEILAEFNDTDRLYLREYQNILTVLQEGLNQSTSEYSSNTKVEVLKENILDLKQYFETKNMSVNLANILEYEVIWKDLESQLFKTKVGSLVPWKLVLQKIETTILEAKVGTDAKEKVLEKLYYLREAANDLNNLFIFSDSYLQHSKKVKIYTKLMQDIVSFKKANILFMHEIIEYLRGMSLLALLGVSLTAVFSGWLRKVVGLNAPQNETGKRSEKMIPNQINKTSRQYLVNEQELHEKITSIVDTVLMSSPLIKPDALPGTNNRGKKRNKNNKRIGRDLSRNIN